jgi:hypothetical protein
MGIHHSPFFVRLTIFASRIPFRYLYKDFQGIAGILEISIFTLRQRSENMKRSKLFFILLVLVLLAGACTGSSETDQEIVDEVLATEEPADTPLPPTPEPTATEEMIMLPVSMVNAVLGEGAFNQYKVVLPGGAPLEFEEGDLPAPPGSVTAHWFTSGGFYVVGYYGLDLEENAPFCPGNSIMTGNGFEHVSNAPTEEGACEGLATLTDDPDVGPLDCYGTLFYRTAIPSNLQGTLFGTLEKLDADGNLAGITSQAQSTTSMLEIDLADFCP